jgi:hypothetical protein
MRSTLDRLHLVMGAAVALAIGAAPAPAQRPPRPAVSPPPLGIDSLRVTRPMTQLERGVVLLAAVPPAITLGTVGAALGIAGATAVCLGGADDAVDALRECHVGAPLVAAGVLGVLVGAARGANGAARRLGCAPAESRRRAYAGGAVGVLWGIAPAAVYLALGGRSAVAAEVLAALVAPITTVAGSTRATGRCRVPVPILR